jgi:hypothetical protein
MRQKFGTKEIFLILFISSKILFTFFEDFFSEIGLNIGIISLF